MSLCKEKGLQMQAEVRGLKTENHRILDILQNPNTEDDSST